MGLLLPRKIGRDICLLTLLSGRCPVKETLRGGYPIFDGACYDRIDR